MSSAAGSALSYLGATPGRPVRSSVCGAVPRLLACRPRQVQEGRQEPPHRASRRLRAGSGRYDAIYEAESIRGASPRTLSDVVVGDQLGPSAKGPLSVTDMVAWHVGVGWGMYGGGTSRIAYRNRRAFRSSMSPMILGSSTPPSAATGTTSGRSAWDTRPPMTTA